MTGLNKKVFVIFGGTGDLTFNKLLPALYDLMKLDELTPDNAEIVLVGRRDYTSDSIFEKALPFIFKNARFKQENQELIHRFKAMITYFQMDFGEYDSYPLLKNKLAQMGNHYLFYLATAPNMFATISNHLLTSGILSQATDKQLLIEKPFGDDLASAKAIDKEIKKAFNEREIYRIDHYLAKEMMMNILTIRFSNQVFEQLWNLNSIENIQITAFEETGVNDRGGYYDKAGALQDMFQSHLLQILSYLIMPRPKSTDVNEIHTAQQIAIDSLSVSENEQFKLDYVKGQYLGTDELKGYLQEAKIDPNSQTETFMALKLTSSLECFKDVPIYVRTGKRMSSQSTYVAITFKPVVGIDQEEKQSNVLIIRIGPDEGIYFKVNIKKPGHFKQTDSIWMDFCQSCIFENRLNTPKAYERLFLYALQKDQTLFTSWEMAQKSWEITEKIKSLDVKFNQPVYSYESFSDGPLQSQTLLNQYGHEWVDEKVYGQINKESV